MDQSEYRKLKHLLEPCQTVDELDKYLRFWLKLDLPWDTVDDDSTSAPLKFVWQCYRVMLTGKGPHTHILAASRNCQKTLTSSTIQYLSLLHFRRDGVHIAAELNQSQQAITYLDKFMSLPELEPFQNKNNVRIKQFVNLPPNDFTDKSDSKLQVVTASKKGANSSRASLLTFDEVDLTPQAILDEAAYIGDPTRDRHRFNPIFIYLSSRKSPDGPVQNLLNKAEKENTGDEKIHKWSAADFMQACPPEVHKPELGPSLAFLHNETLKVIWGEENFHAIVPEARRGEYKPLKVFEGCQTCPVFIPCLGYSAKQRGKSWALRTRDFTKQIVGRITDPSMIIAQTLNFKPETTAIVFRTFSRHKHLLDPIDFYKWVCGARFNPLGLADEELDEIEDGGDPVLLHSITPNKENIYHGMVSAGWTMASGVDFGHSPDPAVTLIIGWHRKLKKCAVLTLESANGFANNLWADYSCKYVYSKFPVEFVAPDCVPDKAAPSYFAMHKVASLDAKPSRIEPGVSFIRGLLWNPLAQDTNFAILDDSQIDNKNIMLVESLENWTHLKTPLGYNMEKFEDNQWTHALDALRYVLNPFIEDVRISIDVKVGMSEAQISGAAKQGDPEAQKIMEQKQLIQNQMQEHLSKNFGIHDFYSQPPTPSPSAPKKSSSGGIKFKF